MMRRINQILRRLPVWAVWLAGLIPLALLVWDTVQGNLGVDPVVRIEHRLGRTALYYLIGALAVTPLLRLGRLNLIRFRRALGLLGFTYICLHLAAWVVLDMGLLWTQMLKDVVKRPYLTFGMVALALLIPLAVTSNNLSIRRMGARSWQNLHRLAYPATALAGLHYLWVGKVAKPQPLFWLGIIVILLILRLGRR
ncbi:protein-methionine-sulfoxide reductase heme-binding subunit MsrQ [Paracoccus sp. DMF-8]|uniref:protein-methionine-sulfoxide reductase heme-binding subunit MsrQ n=1 Tax=Paracoccus sp. DMF-8 TaxID=3019445 RepID=UPI0023E8DA59|nr:protein-methionine-sulfoxide reductase heme-binding subunit MsrQ [Paracoccus sp. DMF-8]MDF3605089.1 protein-methionine-sulfoxide reductase heme-binding subunit MsrQ [Paracoccus sp. DMF-8]